VLRDLSIELVWQGALDGCWDDQLHETRKYFYPERKNGAAGGKERAGVSQLLLELLLLELLL